MEVELDSYTFYCMYVCRSHPSLCFLPLGGQNRIKCSALVRIYELIDYTCYWTVVPDTKINE